MLLAALLLVVTLPLLAANDVQSVTPSPVSQTKSPSTATAVTFVYSATATGTTGLGLRIHFDSSRLTFNSLSAIFGAPSGGGPLFVMGPSDVEIDAGNEDGDNSTDKVIVLAWVNIMSGFPGSLPQNLFTINFTTSAGFSAATRVNISAVDTAAGYGFQSTSALISPPGAPTPTPLPPTPTPPPGSVNAELDIDANGQVKTFSDGLLVFRYLAGFRGTDLTNNAVAPNCTRCTAAQIESYIAFVKPQLDIDNNGSTLTFSDGLLIFRYLAGFRGTDLTNNAVAGNCSVRCNAAAIEPYILGLTQ